MGADAFLGTVANGSDVKIGVKATKDSLDVCQGLIGGNDLLTRQGLIVQTGTKDIDPIEEGFSCDCVLASAIGKTFVFDRKLKVLSHLEPVDDLADP